MHIVSGSTQELPEGKPNELANYRYRVFVEQLGWELPANDKLELDQFDRSDTVYVIGEKDGRLIGCARLLPTTRPYLLSDVFPDLLNGMEPPASPDIWELSRFAAIDFDERNTAPSGQFSSDVAIELLRESLACAKSKGAKRVICVSTIGVERLMRRAGFDCHRVGPPKIVDGYPLIACWITP